MVAMTMSTRTSETAPLASVCLKFEGLQGCLRMDNAMSLLPILRIVAEKWRFDLVAPNTRDVPFARVVGLPNERFQIFTDSAEPREWDAVNTVCDVISELAWERIRSSPELLCLHTAAVQFADKLVLFPNARRAGKSTLACALGRMGKRLFTDDFLPMKVSDDGRITGISNGILARIRLPLPKTFSPDFKDWILKGKGPENRQYKYLETVPVAAQGASLPIGAIVVLKRSDDPILPSLEPIERSRAIATMITQNFSRELFAGRILNSIGALTRDVPLFQLNYSCAEAAAEFLTAQTMLYELPEAKLFQRPGIPALAQLVPTKANSSFSRYCTYRRVAGAEEVHVESQVFVSDRIGFAIHHLNEGSTAIWRLLDEPITAPEIVDLLCAAFTDADPDVVRSDTLRTLEQLLESGLIEEDKRQNNPQCRTE